MPYTPFWRVVALTCWWTLGTACADSGADAPPPGTVAVEGGAYALGSDSAERELGYRGSPDVVREQAWYDAWEADPRRVELDPFALDATPVTQSEYADFVDDTGRPTPDIDSTAYHAQGFLVHGWDEVKPYRWDDRHPPNGLGDHPVVLVDHADAAAYCAWRGERDGVPTRLPTSAEWEAACQGKEDRLYPWGDTWRDRALVSDSTFSAPVGAHPAGATPDGIHDLLGNVFEWTSSTMPPPEGDEPILRGCGWDDADGTCRCAFRHGRPPDSRHILIGFRCAVDLER